MIENYAAVTTFDDPDRATPVGTFAFFPSLDNAENYKHEIKELNPHCHVLIFRYTAPEDREDIEDE